MWIQFTWFVPTENGFVWGAKCKAKFARCFTELWRCQFVDLNKCEKRHKFHVSICLFSLPIFVAIIFVTFAYNFEYHVNWPAKLLQSKKSIAKIGTLNLKKKYGQKLAREVRKKICSKIGALNVQKK